jgi:DNA polymerase III alpha subunit
MANIDGYYYKPRIDLELLFNIPKDNVIVTSACVAGWNYENAEDIWLKVHKYFGDNFFLEVQYHNTDKQKELNKKILRIAKEHNIQIICGLDSHYVKDENSIKRDQILKYKNINYPDEEGWYLDYPDTKTVIKRFEEQVPCLNQLVKEQYVQLLRVVILMNLDMSKRIFLL